MKGTRITFDSLEELKSYYNLKNEDKKYNIHLENENIIIFNINRGSRLKAYKRDDRKWAVYTSKEIGYESNLIGEKEKTLQNLIEVRLFFDNALKNIKLSPEQITDILEIISEED